MDKTCDISSYRDYIGFTRVSIGWLCGEMSWSMVQDGLWMELCAHAAPGRTLGFGSLTDFLRQRRCVAKMEAHLTKNHVQEHELQPSTTERRLGQQVGG